jgi:hypothetical protein
LNTQERPPPAENPVRVKARPVLAASLAACAALGAAPAAAHDHRPPEASIVTPRDSAEGRRDTFTWAIRDGRYCEVMHGDGPWRSDRPVLWVPGDELVIRFETSHRPHRVDVKGYLVGDPTAGVPIYGQVEVPYRLRRARVDGRVVWEAVLDPPPAADLYLDVTVSWKDVDGCGMQSVSWTFRAGLLPI